MGKTDITQPEPKVSVIMPVYNTEKYVVDALNSVINQTLTDIEIIIINDGSTDNSLQVVTQMAETDDRIRVVSKKNEGPSESRNMGIEMAKGKYLYYMDSDDLLEKEALEVCFDRCERNTLDFVFFDATAFKADLSESLNDYYTRTNILDEDKVYTGEEVLQRLMDVNLYRSAVWLCFVRRDYLESIGLRFYHGIIHEDELYSGILHVEATRVEYISQYFFRRRIRPNSITSNKFSEKNMDCYYVVLSELIKYGKKDGHKQIVDKLCAYILNPAIYRAASFSFGERMRQWKLCRKYGLMKYITTKNKLLLICPYLIKLKSIAK